MAANNYPRSGAIVPQGDRKGTVTSTVPSRNGYEIRMQCLAQAQDLLQREYDAKQERAMSQMPGAIQHATKVQREEAYAKLFPTPISTDDIVKTASTLYAFVSNKTE